MHDPVAASLSLLALLLQLIGLGLLAETARQRGRWTPWLLLAAYLLFSTFAFPPAVRVALGDPRTPVNPYALPDALRYLLQSLALLAGCWAAHRRRRP